DTMQLLLVILGIWFARSGGLLVTPAPAKTRRSAGVPLNASRSTVAPTPGTVPMLEDCQNFQADDAIGRFGHLTSQFAIQRSLENAKLPTFASQKSAEQ